MATAQQQTEELLRNPNSALVIHDNAHLNLGFNIMKDRRVEENFYVKEYRVWDRYAEATFDRDYVSNMKKSPNHLIFFTACAHTQKLLYVALCKELGFTYSAEDDEKFKFWPTKVEVDMPGMVRQNKNVLQQLWIEKFELVEKGVYDVVFHITFNSKVTIQSTGKIYLVQ